MTQPTEQPDTTDLSYWSRRFGRPVRRLAVPGSRDGRQRIEVRFDLGESLAVECPTLERAWAALNEEADKMNPRPTERPDIARLREQGARLTRWCQNTGFYVAESPPAVVAQLFPTLLDRLERAEADVNCPGCNGTPPTDPASGCIICSNRGRVRQTTANVLANVLPHLGQTQAESAEKDRLLGMGAAKLREAVETLTKIEAGQRVKLVGPSPMTGELQYSFGEYQPAEWARTTLASIKDDGNGNA